MFIRFFKNNNPSYFFILPVFALVFWIVAFLHPPVLVSSHSTILFDALAKYINLIPLVGTSVSFLLVIAGSFLINFVVNENEITDRKTFLPALFYIVIMSNNEAMLVFHPAMLANLFIIFALHKMMNAYRKNSAFSEVFDAGFLLSMASVFYFPSVILFPVLGFGLFIFRTFNWRELFVSFLGVCVPYCFVVTYYFWNDSLMDYWNDKLAYFIYHERPSFDFSSSFYFLLFTGGVIALLSFSKLSATVLLGSQKTKKNVLFFIWFFVICIGSLFPAPELSSPYFAVLAIPFSVFATNYFFNMKKEIWGEFFFLLFIASILINDFAKYF